MQHPLKQTTSIFGKTVHEMMSGDEFHNNRYFCFLQPSESLYISVFLLVLLLESLAHGLFHELGSCLGGTAVGYAVVVPTNYCRWDTSTCLVLKCNCTLKCVF